ncbi:MAG: amidohydrolase family protein [Methanohalobium sp.]
MEESMQTVLQGATIFDGTDNGFHTDAVMVFQDDKIVYIGSQDECDIEINDDALVYDVSGQFIIPGLIDTHVHLDLHGVPDTYQENLLDDKYRAIRAAVDMEKTAKAGFTTVRNVGSVNFIDIAVKKAVEEGLIGGPRILTSGKIICMQSSGSEYFSGLYREADGIDENRKAAREQLKEGVDFLKVMATGAIMNPGGVPGAPQLNVEEIRAVVDEGLKLGIYTAAHAHGAEGIKNAINAGVRTIEHGTLADDETLWMMKNNDVYLVSTLSSNYFMVRKENEEAIPEFMREKAEEVSQMRKNVIRKALDIGVKVIMGTDAGTPYNYHGNNSMELVRYVRENLMTTEQAIIASTKTAAEAIGIGDITGTLEAGKSADCVVLKKDPMDDVTCLLDTNNISMTFKEGKLLKCLCEWE